MTVDPSWLFWTWTDSKRILMVAHIQYFICDPGANVAIRYGTNSFVGLVEKTILSRAPCHERKCLPPLDFIGSGSPCCYGCCIVKFCHCCGGDGP